MLRLFPAEYINSIKGCSPNLAIENLKSNNFRLECKPVKLTKMQFLELNIMSHTLVSVSQTKISSDL